MVSWLSILAVALAPIIYLAVVIYGYDKYDREPKKILLDAFLLGMVSMLGVGILAAIYEAIGWVEKPEFYDHAVYMFLGVGLTEEFCKFLVVRLHAYRLPEFNEPFDGIVYTVFVGLGFAALENIFYVVEHGLGVGLIRMFTAVPAHYAFGVIMGYYVGKAKFNEVNKTQLLVKGLLIATFLHGAYDFFISQQQYPFLGILTFVVLGLSWIYSKKAIREMQRDSKFRFAKDPKNVK